MLAEADKAPQLKVAAYDGRVFDIGAPGMPTVLFFYPAADTPG